MTHLKAPANFFWAALIIANSATNADSFIIGVENIDYFPIYQYSDNRYTGAAAVIIDRFAQLNDHSITYRAFPLTRLNTYYLNGTIDFRFPDNPLWLQKPKTGYDIHYSSAVIDFIDGVMVKPKNLSKGKASLKQLGIVRGFTPWDYLGDIKAGNILLNETNSILSLLKLTSLERYDGAYLNIDIARHHQANAQDSPEQLVFDPELPYTQSSYSLSSYKYPNVIEQFNQFLIEQKDWIKTVKEKYKVR